MLPDDEKQAVPIDTITIEQTRYTAAMWSYAAPGPGSFMPAMVNMLPFDNRYVVLSFFQDGKLFYREFYPNFLKKSMAVQMPGFFDAADMVKSLGPARLRYVSYLRHNKLWPVLPDYSAVMGLRTP